ncbi:MAG: hypothetical protein VB878_06335 [Pirellulaceae bacterium]
MKNRSRGSSVWRLSAIALAALLATTWIGCGGGDDDGGGTEEDTTTDAQIDDSSDLTLVSLKVPNMV